jgi:hypothetical protein
VLAACFTSVSCLAYYSNPKMKAMFSSEKSTDYTELYIPEGRTLHIFLYQIFILSEKSKFRIIFVFRMF